jgi:sugar phosphate permease
MENSPTLPTGNRSGALAIAIGGLSAGTLDILQACILFGWGIPKVIAAGVLGPRVIHSGGVAIYILGLILHYFIACSAAAIYFGASRKLLFLRVNWIVCGLFFGMAVENVMNLIVLPLSALHSRGPYDLKDLILGFVVHMIVVGLPISYSVRRFAG